MASNYCIKQIDIEKFIEAFNGWTHGKYSLNKASKIMGVNWEITKKYFGKVLLNEPLPDNLFYGRKLTWEGTNYEQFRKEFDEYCEKCKFEREQQNLPANKKS